MVPCFRVRAFGEGMITVVSVGGLRPMDLMLTKSATVRKAVILTACDGRYDVRAKRRGAPNDAPRLKGDSMYAPVEFRYERKETKLKIDFGNYEAVGESVTVSASILIHDRALLDGILNKVGVPHGQA